MGRAGHIDGIAQRSQFCDGPFPRDVLRGVTMKKLALGVAVAAVGVFTHSISASADKLDDVLARLDAIEQNNKKLAGENAALKARLNKVETVKPAPAPVRAASAPATGTATPMRA